MGEDLQVMNRMVDFIGDLGARWGLSEQGCRAHTYLYLSGRPATIAEIASGLSIAQDDAVDALAFLHDYGMATERPDGRWSTGDDPRTMLVAGLSRRREREIGPALAILRECHGNAAAQDGALAGRIGKLLSLAEDLAAIDAQASRIPPGVMRSVLNVSGRAARLLNGRPRR